MAGGLKVDRDDPLHDPEMGARQADGGDGPQRIEQPGRIPFKSFVEALDKGGLPREARIWKGYDEGMDHGWQSGSKDESATVRLTLHRSSKA